jgi:hypothetical protein
MPLVLWETIVPPAKRCSDRINTNERKRLRGDNNNIEDNSPINNELGLISPITPVSFDAKNSPYWHSTDTRKLFLPSSADTEDVNNAIPQRMDILEDA